MTVRQGQDVPQAIVAMAAAVQAGEFGEAESLGAAASVPLSISKAALRLGERISEGAQGSVHVATYTPAGGGPPRPVAVKRPRIGESADLERFRQEVALLAALQHHGLVGLVGARLLPPEYCLVLDLEATNAATELHEAGWRPDWGTVAALGVQLADTLAHMHAHGVLHRDIKPANLLLDASRRRLRLADLGLAAPAEEVAAASSLGSKPTGGFHKQHMVGTLEYLAPEVLLGGRHSRGADVFALAVTLAELASGLAPYSDCTRDNPLAHTVLEMGYGRQELAAAVAAEGLRPSLPEGTPPAARALLEACWAADPAARPAAAKVAAALAELAEEWGCGAFSPCGSPAAPAMAPPTPGQTAAPTPAASTGGETDSDVDMEELAGSSLASSDSERDLTLLCTTSEDEQELPTARASASPLKQQLQPAAGPSGRWGDAPPAWLVAARAAAVPQQAGQAAAAALAGPAVGAFASAGARGGDRMEDFHLILRDLGGWEGVTVFGAFDGHRGAAAAAFLAERLEGHLAARWGSARSAGELLAGALADADTAFRAEQDAAWAARVAAVGPVAAGRQPFPGSTAVLALVAGGLVAVANLGDSRAVLSRDGEALELTQDQTADRADERARIAAAGGRLRHVLGGWRVGEAGMQVTRSVGDADLKGEGVIAEAEVAEVRLTGADAFLVLATDGVWDQLSSGDAVALVTDTVKQPAMCAQRLVVEALARGSRDNLTALVAVLPGAGLGTAERVFVAAGAGVRARGVAQGGRRAQAAPALAADEMADIY